MSNAILYIVEPDVFVVKSVPKADEVHFISHPSQLPTRTPYLPFTNANLGLAAVDLPPPTAINTPEPLLELNYYGVDFNRRDLRVVIQIHPQDGKINAGKPIKISFSPGKTCNFGDQRACVNTFLQNGNEEVIFLTIHSGVGGEAEGFRRALEGSGINRAGYSLKKIDSNLARFAGSKVTISQGDLIAGDFKLLAVIRIPATLVRKYFRSSIVQSIDLAASVEPELNEVIRTGKPLLVIETCGWKSIEEPWSPGVTSTTGSVYLGIIQQAR